MRRPFPWPAVVGWLIFIAVMWTSGGPGMGLAFFGGLGLFFTLYFWCLERFPRTTSVLSIFIFGGRGRRW
jgi:hypothetical protein